MLLDCWLMLSAFCKVQWSVPNIRAVSLHMWECFRKARPATELVYGVYLINPPQSSSSLSRALKCSYKSKQKIQTPKKKKQKQRCTLTNMRFADLLRSYKMNRLARRKKQIRSFGRIGFLITVRCVFNSMIPCGICSLCCALYAVCVHLAILPRLNHECRWGLICSNMYCVNGKKRGLRANRLGK